MLTEETITVKEYSYEVSKAIVLEHRIPKESITNRDKLFTLKY